MFEWYISRETDKPQWKQPPFPPKPVVIVVAVLVFGAAHVVSNWTGLPLFLSTVGVIAVLVVIIMLVVRKFTK
jgi:hypothetical protein